MAATRLFSTKRARGSRLTEASEGSSGLSRFLGKAPGVTALLPPRLFVKIVLRFGRIRARRAFRNFERFQKLRGRQHRAPGPAGGVLDLPIGADDDGAVSQLPREPHQLIVGRQRRAREEHANASRRRRAAGQTGPVEHNREIVPRGAGGPPDESHERSPSRFHALGLSSPEVGIAPDDVVAIDEPPHGASILFSPSIRNDPWTIPR